MNSYVLTWQQNEISDRTTWATKARPFSIWAVEMQGKSSCVFTWWSSSWWAAEEIVPAWTITRKSSSSKYPGPWPFSALSLIINALNFVQDLIGHQGSSFSIIHGLGGIFASRYFLLQLPCRLQGQPHVDCSKSVPGRWLVHERLWPADPCPEVIIADGQTKSGPRHSASTVFHGTDGHRNALTYRPAPSGHRDLHPGHVGHLVSRLNHRLCVLSGPSFRRLAHIQAVQGVQRAGQHLHSPG